jgi:hypothetical protein
MPRLQELCADPQFDCVPSAATRGERSIQIDTNLAVPRRAPSFG